jgi:hypothetical protein
MRLSELQGKGQNQPTYEQHNVSGDPGGTLQPGTIRNAVPYQRPIDALLNGQPVKLIKSGDIVGMSSAEKFVDQKSGKMDWASTDDFTVIDQTLVSDVEQRQRLLSQRR